MGSSPAFLDPIALPLIRGSTILDVACGFGRWGCLFRSNYFEWGLQGFPEVTGVDGDENCCRHAKSLGVYKEIWLKKLPCEFPPKAFDTVFASEVIEHLPEEHIETFIQSLKNAAKMRVIITTPNFECLRGASHSPIGVNELDAHLSTISIKKLRRHGFVVHGAGFGNRTYIRTRLISKIAQLFRIDAMNSLVGFSFHHPHLAHTLVAHWDVDQPH